MVLTITKLTSGNGRYYLDDLATELSPARGPADMTPMRPGRWVGAGAAEVGLTGPVEDRDLAAVLEARRPVIEKSRPGRHRVNIAYDLTFTAPKGVSVLFALGDPEVAQEVLSAHTEAVGAAMGYVERRAAGVQRYLDDGERIVLPANPIGAEFTHGVSRTLDPHLHTHVLVANVARGSDGRWTSISGRGLYFHRRAAGELYDAHLRNELSTRLGVEWRDHVKGLYEVKGIGPSVLGGFSGRQADVRAYLAEHRSARLDEAGSGRLASRQEVKIALLKTRPAKSVDLQPEELQYHWREQAAALGFTRNDLAVVIGPPRDQERHIDEGHFAGSLKRLSFLTRHDAMGALAGALRDGAPVDRVGELVEQLTDWGYHSGPVEGRHSVNKVLPTRYQLLALGNRPASPDQLAVWLDAARAIEKYRNTWKIDDPDRALGSEEWRRESTSTRESSREFILQLAGHHEASREIENARRQLGREREGPELGLGR
jgi:conjugative relaxase-like TrwC/TraI family protein